LVVTPGCPSRAAHDRPLEGTASGETAPDAVGEVLGVGVRHHQRRHRLRSDRLDVVADPGGHGLAGVDRVGVLVLPAVVGPAIIRRQDLRPTWATLALAAGVDVVIVSRRLGQGSPTTTWQTYQHVVAGIQTDAAEKVAALIFGPSNRHLKLVSGEGDDDQSGPVRRLATVPKPRRRR
jgi:hypothetical protein